MATAGDAASVVDLTAADIETFLGRRYTWPEALGLHVAGGRFAGRLRYLKTAVIDINTRSFAPHPSS